MTPLFRKVVKISGPHRDTNTCKGRVKIKSVTGNRIQIQPISNIFVAILYKPNDFLVLTSSCLNTVPGI